MTDRSRLLKALARIIMAVRGLSAFECSQSLNPPIKHKTLSRVMGSEQALSPSHHRALSLFCALELKCPLEMLAAFERTPLAPELFDLLAHAVGEPYAINERSLRALRQRIRLFERTASLVSIFDVGWPDDIFVPTAEDVADLLDSDDATARRKVTMLHSALRRTTSGDADMANELIETAIDAVETHHTDLRIANDVPAALQPFESVTLFDRDAAMIQRRDSHAIVLIVADTDPFHIHVVNTLHDAMAELDARLCHAKHPKAVITLLEGFLTPASWRFRNGLNGVRE